MSKFNVHSVHFDFINTATGTPMAAPITVGAVTASDIQINSETRGDDTGGIYDVIRCLVSQMPEMTFTSKSLQAVINIVGLNGVCFHSDGSHPGIIVYGQLINECNTPAGVSHISLTFPRGLVRGSSLDVARTEDATISYTVDALSDGSAAPVIPSTVGVVLPTLPLTAKYAMGAAKIGDVVISEPTDLNLDFGLQLTEKMPAVGSVWPETVGVKKVQPRLTIRGQDPRLFTEVPAAGIPLLGIPVTNLNSLIQFKKRAAINAFEADANPVHFSYSINGLATINTAFSSSSDDPATIEAVVEGTEDEYLVSSPVLFNPLTTYDPTP